MHTAYLPTLCVLVATTRSQYHGVGYHVNKLEQFPSDDHQMQAAGG